MEFDEIIVKESPGLCRCCLSEGCYKDLGTEYSWMNDTEVYADMLLECFDIGISQHNDGPNGPNRLICEVCITRLRDACNFKKQVLEAEKGFIDMIGRGDFRPKVMIYPAMKPETVTEDAPTEDGEVEYLEEEMEFEDDQYMPLLEEATADASDDVPIASLRLKNKRGRPKKTSTIVKPEKKIKAIKMEEKPRTSKAVYKGEMQPMTTKTSMTTIKRNRLMKRNAIIVLEHSTVIPFKWQRQNYLCFFCHSTFKDTESLKTHTKENHGKPNIRSAVSYLKGDEKVKIDVSAISCRDCGEKIEDLPSLTSHIEKVHRKTFTEGCGYGLIPYRLHDDSFQCAICAKTFQYFIKLNQHMNEHFGNYVCELCGKYFLSKARLRAHSLNHRPGYHCTECSETFKSITQKKNHQKKFHKKLKCFYCPETFPNYNRRKKHYSTVHNIEMPQFNCPVCGKVFLVMSRMKVHLQAVHVRERNFPCSMCDQKFFSRSMVKRHMNKHFGERIPQY